MRRNLTGTSFALLLLVVVTMKQVALGFCLCTQTYFSETCDCHHDETTAGCSSKHACNCYEQRSSSEKEAPSPCKDCESNISLDPGDFLWSPLADPIPAYTVDDPPALYSSSLHHLGAGFLAHRFLSPRGSPPGTPPLFIRHSSLRL